MSVVADARLVSTGGLAVGHRALAPLVRDEEVDAYIRSEFVRPVPPPREDVLQEE